MTDSKYFPLVSVVIPTYNAAAFIERTLVSVINQTYPNLEIICVDDCSTDDTVSLIKAINDTRIRVIENDVNSGAGHTRSKGLRAATGRYIALLDSDDIWHPTKISHQVELMDKSSSSAVYTQYNIIDEHDRVYDTVKHLPGSVDYKMMLRHCYIRTSSLLYDAEAVGRDIQFVDARKRQDYLFFLEMLRRIPSAILLPEVACSYRVHSGGISSRKIQNVPYQWNVYRRYERFGLVKSLMLMASWFIRSGHIVIRRKALSIFK